MPATESANAPRPRGHPVAALSGSMVYARILAIGGHLGKSPHFYVSFNRPIGFSRLNRLKLKEIGRLKSDLTGPIF